MLGVTDVGAYYPHTVTYHPTCHGLRMLGLGDRPRRLLEAVEGLHLLELEGAEECCGFGGTFAVKNADVSAAMGADKVQHIEETGAEMVCTVDNSCLMHIGGTLTRRGSAVRPVHIAEILASTEGGTSVSGTYLGMPSFPQAAAESTRDTRLRGNLRHATHTIRAKRAQAVEELGDWAELRAAGAALKNRVLRHLDHYLEQLEEAVTAAGGQVHWAADADEANRIVTGLVRETGETEVVKVKSMATQEIGLNEALAEAGVSAYETDLAELIVQLGDDLPSHILVPAIHRNRDEIRDIFREKMGEWGRAAPKGLTDDPAELAEAARVHLREKFLSAKVGISGANFMVAETGTLVVVESEGNGRMCLTLPETLISVVGIEKVVPTWQDLEVFLQTLPRSSTAERMNPYTSTWTGTTGDDGPSDVPSRAARQRAYRRTRRHRGPAGAALHPVLGLPERLPRLRTRRRPRLRLALSRPHRRDPHAPTARCAERAGRVAAVRIVPVRRLLRGVPRRHRHPGGPRPSAGTRRRGRHRQRPGPEDDRPAREGPRGGAGSHAGGPLDVRASAGHAHGPATGRPYALADPAAPARPGRGQGVVGNPRHTAPGRRTVPRLVAPHQPEESEEREEPGGGRHPGEG